MSPIRRLNLPELGERHQRRASVCIPCFLNRSPTKYIWTVKIYSHGPWYRFNHFIHIDRLIFLPMHNITFHLFVCFVLLIDAFLTLHIFLHPLDVLGWKNRHASQFIFLICRIRQDRRTAIRSNVCGHCVCYRLVSRCIFSLFNAWVISRQGRYVIRRFFLPMKHWFRIFQKYVFLLSMWSACPLTNIVIYHVIFQSPNCTSLLMVLFCEAWQENRIISVGAVFLNLNHL